MLFCSNAANFLLINTALLSVFLPFFMYVNAYFFGIKYQTKLLDQSIYTSLMAFDIHYLQEELWIYSTRLCQLCGIGSYIWKITITMTLDYNE